MSIMKSLFLVTLLICLPLLQACQPGYVLDQSGKSWQASGLPDQYNIKRWNHLQIPNNARILVSADQASGIDNQKVVAAVAKTLGPYFEAVTAVEGLQTQEQAQRQAKQEGFNFLLQIELFDQSSLLAKKYYSGGIRYRTLHLNLVLIDAVHNTTVDKVHIKTSASPIKFYGAPIAKLLNKPVDKLGRQLTGV